MSETSTEATAVPAAPGIPDGMALVPIGELAAFGVAMERFQVLLAEARSLAGKAAAGERDRIRAAVGDLKFTLFRPGNGPGQEQAMDVVPLESLLGLLAPVEGGGPS